MYIFDYLRKLVFLKETYIYDLDRSNNDIGWRLLLRSLFSNAGVVITLQLYIDLKLIIEVDGKQHDLEENLKYDNQRDKYL